MAYGVFLASLGYTPPHLGGRKLRAITARIAAALFPSILEKR